MNETTKKIKNHFYNNRTHLLYINVYDKEDEAHLVIKHISKYERVNEILEKIETGEYFIYRDIYSNQVKLAISPKNCLYQIRI